MIPGIFAAQVRRTPAPPVTDPYWANVSALLHLDGNATDQKSNTFTSFGSPAFSDGKFGQSLTSPTGNSGFYSAAGVEGFALTGDFTVELWFRAASSVGSAAVISCFHTTGGPSWQIYYNGSKLQWYQYSGSGSYPITSAASVNDNVFHHVAFSRSGSTLRLFIDGALDSSVSNTTVYANSGINLSIGYQHQGVQRYPFRGSIDEVRITKGVARYTAAFTPPDAPFPNS